MIYDPKNILDLERAKRRFKQLCNQGKIFELTEIKPNRTLSQNSYLHLILGWFSCEYGCTIEYAKKYYFKILCNPELFIIENDDKFLGKIKNIRSSADLDSGQMSEAIERFRNWSNIEAGIYLPEPNETSFLQSIEIEIQKNKTFL